MFKKLLHRITVVWCLYGLVRLCIFVHPYLLWCFAKIDPDFKTDDGPYVMWFSVIFGLFLVSMLGLAIHYFANWFFNTEE